MQAWQQLLPSCKYLLLSTRWNSRPHHLYVPLCVLKMYKLNFFSIERFKCILLDHCHTSCHGWVSLLTSSNDRRSDRKCVHPLCNCSLFYFYSSFHLWYAIFTCCLENTTTGIDTANCLRTTATTTATGRKYRCFRKYTTNSQHKKTADDNNRGSESL